MNKYQKALNDWTAWVSKHGNEHAAACKNWTDADLAGAIEDAISGKAKALADLTKGLEPAYASVSTPRAHRAYEHLLLLDAQLKAYNWEKFERSEVAKYAALHAAGYAAPGMKYCDQRHPSGPAGSGCQ